MNQEPSKDLTPLLFIVGGYDKDNIYGGSGNDSLWGGDGLNTIYGDAGNDFIEGGAGNVILFRKKTIHQNTWRWYSRKENMRRAV